MAKQEGILGRNSICPGVHNKQRQPDQDQAEAERVSGQAEKAQTLPFGFKCRLCVLWIAERASAKRRPCHTYDAKCHTRGCYQDRYRHVCRLPSDYSIPTVRRCWRLVTSNGWQEDSLRGAISQERSAHGQINQNSTKPEQDEPNRKHPGCSFFR